MLSKFHITQLGAQAAGEP